jgi:hypothetical protein
MDQPELMAEGTGLQTNILRLRHAHPQAAKLMMLAVQEQ